MVTPTVAPAPYRHRAAITPAGMLIIVRHLRSSWHCQCEKWVTMRTCHSACNDAQRETVDSHEHFMSHVQLCPSSNKHDAMAHLLRIRSILAISMSESVHTVIYTLRMTIKTRLTINVLSARLRTGSGFHLKFDAMFTASSPHNVCGSEFPLVLGRTGPECLIE
jgi:hypothetical protein